MYAAHPSSPCLVLICNLFTISENLPSLRLLQPSLRCQVQRKGGDRFVRHNCLPSTDCLWNMQRDLMVIFRPLVPPTACVAVGLFRPCKSHPHLKEAPCAMTCLVVLMAQSGP